MENLLRTALSKTLESYLIGITKPIQSNPVLIGDAFNSILFSLIDKRLLLDDQLLLYQCYNLRDQGLIAAQKGDLAVSERFFKGVEIMYGYLTLPKDEVHRNLPMILNVHGGPWERDTWGYNAEVQWFADRGYACLQVNYRGSTGYGKYFLKAGNKEWGRNMHNDLVDAVKWAIHQEIADPRKIAIYGSSYGGYAALVGATFTPEVFCCAVDIVGPSDLYTLIKTLPPYWSILSEQLYARVGNPNTEESLLRERSPLFKINQIKIPVFIAQGTNDPRVNQAESEKIVEALKEKGLAYEYLLFSDEGHGFLKLDNRLKFYTDVEKFLATYLGGAYEIE